MQRVVKRVWRDAWYHLMGLGLCLALLSLVFLDVSRLNSPLDVSRLNMLYKMSRLSMCKTEVDARPWVEELTSGSFGELDRKMEHVYSKVCHGDQWFDYWVLGPCFPEFRELHVFTKHVRRRPEILECAAEAMNWKTQFTYSELVTTARNMPPWCRTHPIVTAYLGILSDNPRWRDALAPGFDKSKYEELREWIELQHDDRNIKDSIADEAEASYSRFSGARARSPFRGWKGVLPADFEIGDRIVDSGPVLPFENFFLLNVPGEDFPGFFGNSQQAIIERGKNSKGDP